jgi:hypothetical protein
MKKFVKIVEGFAINVGFMLFGYFMISLFCLLFLSRSEYILSPIV